MPYMVAEQAEDEAESEDEAWGEGRVYSCHNGPCTCCEIATQTRSSSLDFCLAPHSRDACYSKALRRAQARHSAITSTRRTCQSPYQNQSVSS